MLRLGFDPAAPGVDGGTALHAACWVGSVRMVERLLAHGGVPLDARDPTHQSTPLGWAAFGSVHRRARGADYPAVAERLVAAGADITAVGNGRPQPAGDGEGQRDDAGGAAPARRDVVRRGFSPAGAGADVEADLQVRLQADLKVRLYVPRPTRTRCITAPSTSKSTTPLHPTP